jgi:hypothetical protein
LILKVCWLGPAHSRRWTITELAFVTNVVLVFSCVFFSPPRAPHIRLWLDRCCCCSTDTLLSSAWLVDCRLVLFYLGKNL